MTTISKKECIICTDTFTPKNEAICVYCEYITCRSCTRQYVLNETEPKCMNCKKPWTREHQNEILKPIFVNGELKKHLEKVMFDRERAQLVATMEVVEQRRISHRLSSEKTILSQEIVTIRANINLVITKIREIHTFIMMAKTSPKMHPNTDVNTLSAEWNALEKERARMAQKLTQKQERYIFIDQLFRMRPEERRIAYENQINGANPAEVVHTILSSNPNTTHKRHFVRACPVETCRGFLSTQWKCGLCGVNTCSTCHVPKMTDAEESHICNPDDVATAELLAKDTKPCPKCGTGIFKIDGCDQMWCVECHSAFSWRTGELETGNVHNPHFFEYQRRMGTNARNIMDLPCGALNPEHYHGVIHHLQTRVFSNAAKQLRKELELPDIPKETESIIKRRLADVAISITAFMRLLPRYRHDAILDNQELRVKFLTEEFSEEQFRSNLFREAKKFNKEREIGQVIQTVVYAMTDILNRIIQYFREIADKMDNPSDRTGTGTGTGTLCVIDLDKITSLMNEINELMDYANECLAKICVVYKVTRVGLFIRKSDYSNSANNTYTCEAGLFTVGVAKKDNDGKEQISPKSRVS